jgi:hypothetical protein
MNFITGEKFYEIADFIYSTNKINDYNKLVNTFNIEKLKNLNIIYLHTIYKDQFFDIIKNINKKFIIITHNSDSNINFDNSPPNVIKWFSQNVNCKSKKIESLPIGLENKKWFSNLKKKEKILKKITKPKKIKNLLYLNHNINTNLKERKEPYNIFKNKSWVTIENGTNGQNFDNYLDNLYNHKFILSPMGNGIDTHRKWESLYLNTIPIEKRNINNKFYEDLPICFVNNWNDITEDFLNNEYNRIQNTKWNLNKIEFDWWKNKILKIYNLNQ